MRLGKKRVVDVATSTDGISMPRVIDVPISTGEISMPRTEMPVACEETVELMDKFIGFTSSLNVPMQRETDESFVAFLDTRRKGSGEIEVRGHTEYGQMVFTTVKAPKRPKWGDSGEDI